MQQLCEIEHWVSSLVSERNKVGNTDRKPKLERKIKGELAEPYQLEKLKGDASCRCYYRLSSLHLLDDNKEIPDKTESYIVVASPVERIDNTVFIDIANHWRQFGVKTPMIFSVESNKGFMLIEDFGGIHLFDEMVKSGEVDLHKKAINQLLKIQKIPPIDLPVFDRDFLMREMRLFNQWMVEYQLGIEVPACVEHTFQLLVENALMQPQVTMHRDYHSRNLLLCDNEIAVIDFQDAVKGPLAYDLVSLLKDCYLDLSETKQRQLIDEYLEQLNLSGVLSTEAASTVTREKFVRWFDLIGMQRHLKVLGLFIRLGVEERKTGYLQDLPRVFNYVITVAEKYPELDAFHAWLLKDVGPELTKQPWYQS